MQIVGFQQILLQTGFKLRFEPTSISPPGRGLRGGFYLGWTGSMCSIYTSFKEFTHPQPLPGGEF